MGRHPSLLAIGLFAVKSRIHQARRVLEDARCDLPVLPKGDPKDFPFILMESTSPLITTDDRRERALLEGKIRNLRLACGQLQHGVLLPGEIFSFWKQLGPPLESRGFVRGREVREGCIIPTVGGGLCQLSGSLLEVISPFDFELLERHRHTVLPPDVEHLARRDATVFWNYVDLRFRSRAAVMFETYLTENDLVVKLKGKIPQLPNWTQPAASLSQVPKASLPIQSCSTCGETECIRQSGESAAADTPSGGPQP